MLCNNPPFIGPLPPKATPPIQTHLKNVDSKCVFNATLFDKVVSYWFSPCSSVSSTNKTDQPDITEISLKLALNTHNWGFTFTPVLFLPFNLLISCRFLHFIFDYWRRFTPSHTHPALFFLTVWPFNQL
jgi:uncharacterized protein YceK